MKSLNLPPLALSVPADESGTSLGHLLTLTHARLMHRITQLTLDEFGVTGMQGKVLFLLTSGSCTTAADLARYWNIDAGAITRVLDRIEKRGLLQRVRASEDRRVVRLVTTEAGAAIAEAMPRLLNSVIDEALDGLVAEERQALKRMLLRILDNGV